MGFGFDGCLEVLLLVKRETDQTLHCPAASFVPKHLAPSEGSGRSTPERDAPAPV